MGGKQFFCKLDSGIVMEIACNICPSVRTHSGLGEHNRLDFPLGRHQPNALTQPRTPVGNIDPCHLACCSHAGSDFEQSHGSAGVKQHVCPGSYLRLSLRSSHCSVFVHRFGQVSGSLLSQSSAPEQATQSSLLLVHPMAVSLDNSAIALPRQGDNSYVNPITSLGCSEMQWYFAVTLC